MRLERARSLLSGDVILHRGQTRRVVKSASVARDPEYTDWAYYRVAHLDRPDWNEQVRRWPNALVCVFDSDAEYLAYVEPSRSKT